jgi:type II secretory pathway component PulF
MPFFQYQATDKHGRQVGGTLQAASLDEASRALAVQGFQVSSLVDPSLIANSPVARPIPQERPSPVQMRSPSKAAMGEPRKTKYTKDAEVYFLFSQLASYAKSGINPAQAFTEIASKQQRDDLKEALLFTASRVGEGGSIADCLAMYPYLFPPHAVGAVRAGETGGYLPEAFESVAKQADDSRRMRRWMVWLGWFAVGIPPVIPVGRALFKAVLGSWSVQDATGGTAPVASTVAAGFVKEITGPLGIVSLIVFATFATVALLWQTMKFRALRHRFALKLPTIGRRARAEAFASFTWHLGKLSHAAVPPRNAFQLAAETVPNLEIRGALEREGNRMTDRTKLSDALHGTKMLPYELAAMVQTGEVTGDVAGQLFNGARAQTEEFEHQSKYLTQRVGCWMSLLFFLVGPMVVMWLYRDFLLGLFDIFSQE